MHHLKEIDVDGLAAGVGPIGDGGSAVGAPSSSTVGCSTTVRARGVPSGGYCRDIAIRISASLSVMSSPLRSTVTSWSTPVKWNGES
jgi:hypothetical protein